MNENLDLTKILEGCPKGTKFYSPLFGEVRLHRIYGSYGIGMVCVKMNRLYQFNAAGKYEMVEMGCSDSWGNYYYSDECLLFPSKEQKDWSKFERFWDRKFDLNTLEPFDKVLVRNRKTELWLTDMFTFHIDEPVAKCITGAYMQCIPYNEDTKHLLGTKEDCPEFYKWWKE